MGELSKIKTEKALAMNNLIKFVLDKPQVDCNVVHSFGPGIYIREVRIPADTFAIGHYHKKDHLNIFLTGKLLAFNDDGSTKIMQAPMMFTAPEGRKVGYIMEDMVWLNVYATEERNIEKLEEMFFDKGEVWEDHLKNLDIDVARIELHKKDYETLLNELGLTQAQVDEELQRDPVIEMPDGSWSFQVGDSKIHGKGVFASNDIPAGTVIGPALLDGKKTPLGRYTNHGMPPNAAMHKLPNGDILLVATQDIKGYRGGMVGDEIMVNYRQVLAMNEGV